MRDRVARAKAEGRTLEEVLEMRPSAEWDEEWGGGFIDPTAFVTLDARSGSPSPHGEYPARAGHSAFEPTTHSSRRSTVAGFGNGLGRGCRDDLGKRISHGSWPP